MLFDKKEDDNDVDVKIICYESDDENYNNVVLNYNKNQMPLK